MAILRESNMGTAPQQSKGILKTPQNDAETRRLYIEDKWMEYLKAEEKRACDITSIFIKNYIPSFIQAKLALGLSSLPDYDIQIMAKNPILYTMNHDVKQMSLPIQFIITPEKPSHERDSEAFSHTIKDLLRHTAYKKIVSVTIHMPYKPYEKQKMLQQARIEMGADIENIKSLLKISSDSQHEDDMQPKRAKKLIKFFGKTKEENVHLSDMYERFNREVFRVLDGALESAEKNLHKETKPNVLDKATFVELEEKKLAMQ